MAVLSRAAIGALPKIFSAGRTALSALRTYPTTMAAGIGGLYGAASSEAGTLTGRLEDAARGAFWGGAIGSIGKLPYKNIAERLWSNKTVGSRTIQKIGSIGLQAGRYTLENPLKVSGAVAGLYGVTKMHNLYGQTGVSPTLEGAIVNTNYDQQAMMAEELTSTFLQPPGVVQTAPQFVQNNRQRLQNSTFNLVHGLHAGRHG